MKTIMIQGTGSSVGKSLICTALCRILTRKGYNVFPFKTLNITNDVYRTNTGKNIARPQMLQALASNKVPTTAMNPLLIIENDGDYTLYCEGEETSSLDFKNIFKDKIEALKDVYDYCIIEGAGSPSDMVLKDKDISNMFTAEIADASVILVSDISLDQGFNSLLGTMELLSKEEKKKIKGFILNNFKGDKSLIENSKNKISKMIDKDCLGIFPHISFDLHERFTDHTKYVTSNPNAPIDVAVLATPNMSSLTDVAPLAIEPDVSLRIIRDKREFGNPDLLIIPGSSNTCKDMVYIRKLNIESIIREYSKDGLILGICGGYQLLGEKLIDPLGVESDIKEQDAIGLLKVDTIFEKERVYNKASGRIIPLDIEIEGCENHFGMSYNKETNKDFVHIDIENEISISKNEGAYNDSFTIFGTYLHRCFALPYFREYILNRIREKKGLDKKTSKHYNEYLLSQIDKLADAFEDNIDFNHIVNNL